MRARNRATRRRRWTPPSPTRGCALSPRSRATSALTACAWRSASGAVPPRRAPLTARSPPPSPPPSRAPIPGCACARCTAGRHSSRLCAGGARCDCALTICARGGLCGGLCVRGAGCTRGGSSSEMGSISARFGSVEPSPPSSMDWLRAASTSAPRSSAGARSSRLAAGRSKFAQPWPCRTHSPTAWTRCASSARRYPARSRPWPTWPLPHASTPR
mmetsp:Transcript_26405/g.65243  ORF Transcript_26405/g.65243 Transcript_26405/m.65243 type:complete len:216 (+) Transcript_26405:490-1137(+)